MHKYSRQVKLHLETNINLKRKKKKNLIKKKKTK